MFVMTYTNSLQSLMRLPPSWQSFHNSIGLIVSKRDVAHANKSIDDLYNLFPYILL